MACSTGSSSECLIMPSSICGEVTVLHPYYLVKLLPILPVEILRSYLKEQPGRVLGGQAKGSQVVTEIGDEGQHQ